VYCAAHRKDFHDGWANGRNAPFRCSAAAARNGDYKYRRCLLAYLWRRNGGALFLAGRWLAGAGGQADAEGEKGSGHDAAGVIVRAPSLTWRSVISSGISPNSSIPDRAASPSLAEPGLRAKTAGFMTCIPFLSAAYQSGAWRPLPCAFPLLSPQEGLIAMHSTVYIALHWAFFLFSYLRRGRPDLWRVKVSGRPSGGGCGCAGEGIYLCGAQHSLFLLAEGRLLLFRRRWRHYPDACYIAGDVRSSRSAETVAGGAQDNLRLYLRSGASAFCAAA